MDKNTKQELNPAYLGDGKKSAMSLHLHYWALLLALVFCCAGSGGAQPLQPQVFEARPELKAKEAVSAVDSDGDNLTDDMEATLGTSPLHADTDGDGFPDYQEVVEYGFDPANDPYKFNPRIADIPQLDIEISTPPQVHFDYTTGEGKQKSIEIGNTTDTGWSTQNSFSHAVSVGLTVNYGAMGGVGVSTEYSYSYSHTTSSDYRLSHTRTQGEIESEDTTTQGGNILVGVKLHNRGNVQLSVESVRLLALKVPVDDPDKPKFISQLELDTHFTFGGIAKIRPHSSTPGELIFRANLNLDQMKELLQDGSLVIRVADFTLGGSEVFTDINAKTATVVIDPSPGPDGLGNRARTYLVAVHSSDGERGISVGEALRNVLYLNYEAGTTPWKYGDPKNPRVSTTRTGLRSLLGLANDYELNGYWVVHYTTRVGSETKTVEYNPLRENYALDDIRLHSGHILELTYLLDTDRDGLDCRTELMLGTDPQKKDTDGDGLSDGEEVTGWALISRDGTRRRVRSDPLQNDSDGDGFSDAVEKELKTDPLHRNTRVPSLIGMAESEAIRLLEQNKLGYKVTTRETKKQPGVILEQSSRAGDVVLEGAEIALVASILIVPSVLDKSRDEAIILLKEAGLSSRVTERADWDNRIGLVIEQSRVPGTYMREKTPIELVVARKSGDWISFKHEGAYVAKFYLSWEDDDGPHKWASGTKAVGYSYRYVFKGKYTRNIKINAQAHTGFKWKTIWNLRLDEPPNATYTAKGTTLNRKYSKNP